jgi:thymidylate kinase
MRRVSGNWRIAMFHAYCSVVTARFQARGSKPAFGMTTTGPRRALGDGQGMASVVEPRDGTQAIGKYGLITGFCAIGLLLLAMPAADLVWTVPLTLLLIAAAVTLAVAWPILDRGAIDVPMAPLIALVGCDGSGKSTLSNDMLALFSPDHRIALCYLGLGSGEMGERIKRWPLVGAWLERRIARRAGQTRTAGRTIPGLGTALVVYLFSIVRLRRFRQVLALRRRGVIVLTDRYPQIEVAGFYDGPGLSAGRPGTRVVAALAHRERRMYEWMASFAPDVVIRLNVDLETAHARKPDHGYDLLRQKVEVTPRLRFNGAPIVDIDSTEPYENVRAAVSQIVRRTIDAAALRH